MRVDRPTPIPNRRYQSGKCPSGRLAKKTSGQRS
jgi:hypothetical protein